MVAHGRCKTLKKDEHNHEQPVIFASDVCKASTSRSTFHNRCNVLKFTFPDSVITSGIIKIFTVYSDGAIFVMPVLYGVMHFTVFSSMFMPADCNL